VSVWLTGEWVATEKGKGKDNVSEESGVKIIQRRRRLNTLKEPQGGRKSGRRRRAPSEENHIAGESNPN